MRARIVELYRHGVKMKPEAAKLERPIVGQLLVDADATQHKDFRTQAHLYEVQAGWKRSLLPPLFSPQIRRMTTRSFVLRGHQYHAREDGVVAEHVQEWWVRLD